MTEEQATVATSATPKPTDRGTKLTRLFDATINRLLVELETKGPEFKTALLRESLDLLRFAGFPVTDAVKYTRIGGSDRTRPLPTFADEGVLNEIADLTQKGAPLRASLPSGVTISPLAQPFKQP